MIEIGVDEITLVLQLNEAEKYNLSTYEWREKAKKLIEIFEEKANILKIFGEKVIMLRNKGGYNVGYKYGGNNFYFSISYHDIKYDMGVCVKFSAQALEYYCENTQLRVYQLLKIVQDDYYQTRLSRIDLIADYIDEDIKLDHIYSKYRENKIKICREYTGKNNEKKIKAINIKIKAYLNKTAETIIIGSSKSDALLKLYDKKNEQISKCGNKYDKAIASKNWIRLELVYRYGIAHSITDELLNIDNNADYESYIINNILSRFLFMEVDEQNNMHMCDCTQKLNDSVIRKTYAYNTIKVKNYDLKKNIDYIINNSGIMNTFYKINEIWGDKAIELFLEVLRVKSLHHVPNHETNKWIVNHKDIYNKNYNDFSEFLNDSKIL